MYRRLLTTFLIAALVTAFAPAMAFAVTDDAPLGLVLTKDAGSTSGTLLSPSTDPDRFDWYCIHLDEGDEFKVSLTGEVGTDFSLSMYWSGAGTPVYEENDLFQLFMWSGGYPRETSYVVPPSHEGTYSVLVHGTYGQGEPGLYTLTWARSHSPAARLYGMDRYQTAAAISRATFTEAGAAVIASGENYPDALAASGLAGVLDAPVLLTRKAYLPGDVRLELDRLGVTEVYIIGSESAVSADVEMALKDYFVVDRLGGADRFQTARLVADRITFLGGSSEAFLVTGDRYPDALAVAPVAFARKMPVLLTKPGVLSPGTSDALTSLAATHVVIAGSSAAVSTAVADAAEVACAANDTGGGHAVERWEGDDRYATSVSVAEHAVELGWTTWREVALATGWNFPDALGGGAAMGRRGGNLLLSDPRSLSTVSGDTLHANLGDVERVYLLGSSSALNERVRTDAVARLVP